MKTKNSLKREVSDLSEKDLISKSGERLSGTSSKFGEILRDTAVVEPVVFVSPPPPVEDLQLSAPVSWLPNGNASDQKQFKRRGAVYYSGDNFPDTLNQIINKTD